MAQWMNLGKGIWVYANFEYSINPVIPLFLHIYNSSLFSGSFIPYQEGDVRIHLPLLLDSKYPQQYISKVWDMVAKITQGQ